MLYLDTDLAIYLTLSALAIRLSLISMRRDKRTIKSCLKHRIALRWQTNLQAARQIVALETKLAVSDTDAKATSFNQSHFNSISIRQLQKCLNASRLLVCRFTWNIKSVTYAAAVVDPLNSLGITTIPVAESKTGSLSY